MKHATMAWYISTPNTSESENNNRSSGILSDFFFTLTCCEVVLRIIIFVCLGEKKSCQVHCSEEKNEFYRQLDFD